MRMSNEGKIIFNHMRIEYRECIIEQCMWNVNWEELRLAEEIAGRPLPKKFEGGVCNCIPENSIGILEASKVRCYPEG